jgi:hypothetical protein
LFNDIAANVLLLFVKRLATIEVRGCLLMPLRLQIDGNRLGLPSALASAETGGVVVVAGRFQFHRLGASSHGSTGNVAGIPLLLLVYQLDRLRRLRFGLWQEGIVSDRSRWNISFGIPILLLTRQLIAVASGHVTTAVISPSIVVLPSR